MTTQQRGRYYPPKLTGIAVMLAFVIAAGMWTYFVRVLKPYQKRDAAAHDRPRGNLSDLYPRWLGARELLLHGRDPYSPEITREIQQGYYGRVLDPSRPGDPQDQVAFAYPVYVVFLIAPTVRMPFAQVQVVFTTVLWIVTAFSVLLWLHVLRWKPSLPIGLSLAILTLGSLPVIQAIKLQQLTLFVAALLAGCFAAVASAYLSLAGILLALATIKPQLVLLPVLWLMVWSASRWRERWRLAVAFAGTMLILLVGAQVILPGWIDSFIVAIRNYHAYTHNVSLLQLLSTPLTGYALAAILVAYTAWLCRDTFHADSDSLQFAAASGLVLALVVVTVPMFALYNQILLLPALLLLFRDWHLHSADRTSRSLCLITGGLLVWPWIATLALDAALLIFPAVTVQEQWKLPFFTSLTLPLFTFAALANQISRTRVISSQNSDAPRLSSTAPSSRSR